jgi:hypothetical protein
MERETQDAEKSIAKDEAKLEIKELNLTLLEEKAQHIKIEEAQINEIKKKIMDKYSSLPSNVA